MSNHGADLYLDLMKKVLTNTIYADPAVRVWGEDNEEARQEGRDWPSVAHTMVGMKRLENLQHCVESVIRENIPGDLIETGVWRGGSSILMRAVLKAHGVLDRRVWLADSFQGMPVADEQAHPEDQQFQWHLHNDFLAVPLEQVRENFSRYGLLDEQVRFLPGWFADTLPSIEVDKLAVIRLDGDHYDSTMDALVNLYPRLSPGGYVIVDDYVLPPCSEAVETYRRKHGITEPLQPIDGVAMFWQRG
ncbi:TylF/MycF family methyltransferase [Streptomyces sp. NPDC006510]|uniref:TylF/MycF family methyltransferase n=1 Tax=Streptomyces sp. NPDC006510 TaxID=3155600 RepID=UPI00339EA46D